MASKQANVDFVLEQMAGAGDVSARKMFGEYGIYSRGKIVALFCDDQLFVKPTVAGKTFIGKVTEAPPYPGAKPWFLISGDRCEDGEWLSELVRLTERELPAPIPKAPKKVRTSKTVKAPKAAKAKPKKPYEGGVEARRKDATHLTSRAACFTYEAYFLGGADAFKYRKQELVRSPRDFRRLTCCLSARPLPHLKWRRRGTSAVDPHLGPTPVTTQPSRS